MFTDARSEPIFGVARKPGVTGKLKRAHAAGGGGGGNRGEREIRSGGNQSQAVIAVGIWVVIWCPTLRLGVD
jgi:hypothetical protein